MESVAVVGFTQVEPAFPTIACTYKRLVGYLECDNIVP